MNRRDFLKYVASTSSASFLTGCTRTETVSSWEPSGKRPNILLITADDMNYDSLGVSGCFLPGITPNLDRLASEGIRFEHAHVMTAICNPSREAIMTGR